MKNYLLHILATIIAVISRIIEPHPRITDPEERYLSQMLNSLLIIYIPIAVGVIIFRFVLTPNNMTTTVVIASLGMVVVGIIYAIGRSGHYRASVRTTVILGYAVIYVNAVNSDPPHFEISYLIFIPLLSIVLFSLREAILIYVINITLLLVFIATTPSMGLYGKIDAVAFILLALGFILFANYQRTRLDTYRHDFTVQKKQSELVKELISNVSHDFRTPLSTIHTSTYLLQRLEEPEKRLKALNRIEHQALRIEWMVKNLLTLSKLDTYTSSDFYQVDIVSLLNTVTSRLNDMAEAKHITLESDIRTSDSYIHGDAELLDLMLDHLIQNAINYTQDNGSVTLQLQQVDDTHVKISVIDTGIGIVADDLDQIFDRFYRVDKSRSTDTGGNGLGLSIVKQIVDLHGGTIDVESDIGKGSIFSIQLPM